MKVTAIKTNIFHIDDDFYQFLDSSLSNISEAQNLERKVLVVTSKVLAMAEHSVVELDPEAKNLNTQKHQLARELADFYIDPHKSRYNLMLTIIHNTLLVNAGIDNSNSQGHYILLPKDPYQWAEDIWNYLRKKHKLKNFGVIVTDSKSFPLKWGQIGACLAYCGFKPLNNKVGKKDLFGRKMEMTYIGVAEAIAVAAVLEMGEVAEAQPLCLVEAVGQLEFVSKAPTKKEVDFLNINMVDDVYAPILMKAGWKSNKKELK